VVRSESRRSHVHRGHTDDAATKIPINETLAKNICRLPWKKYLISCAVVLSWDVGSYRLRWKLNRLLNTTKMTPRKRHRVEFPWSSVTRNEIPLLGYVYRYLTRVVIISQMPAGAATVRAGGILVDSRPWDFHWVTIFSRSLRIAEAVPTRHYCHVELSWRDMMRSKATYPDDSRRRFCGYRDQDATESTVFFTFRSLCLEKMTTPITLSEFHSSFLINDWSNLGAGSFIDIWSFRRKISLMHFSRTVWFFITTRISPTIPTGWLSIIWLLIKSFTETLVGPVF